MGPVFPRKNGIMSFLKPEAPAIAAPVQPEAPPPVLAPTGSKPGTKNQNKTFLGTGAIANPVGPAGQPGTGPGKTLLGQ